MSARSSPTCPTRGSSCCSMPPPRPGQGLELSSEILAVDRTAHPPPARPRLGLGGCLGPPQVGRLPQRDAGEEQQWEESQPEEGHPVDYLSHSVLTLETRHNLRSPSPVSSSPLDPLSLRERGDSTRPFVPLLPKGEGDRG